MSALKDILAKKTDSQLLYYINNIGKHTDDAVQLALLELQSRGVLLEEGMEEKIAAEIRDRNKPYNFIPDESYRPALFNELTVYVFSILFSVLFGMFLIAYNRKKIGMDSWPVSVAGIVYTIVLEVVKNYYPLGFPYSFIENATGTVLIYQLCWKRKISIAIKYPAKDIWVISAIACGLLAAEILRYLAISL